MWSWLAGRVRSLEVGEAIGVQVCEVIRFPVVKRKDIVVGVRMMEVCGLVTLSLLILKKKNSGTNSSINIRQS